MKGTRLIPTLPAAIAIAACATGARLPRYEALAPGGTLSSWTRFYGC